MWCQNEDVVADEMNHQSRLQDHVQGGDRALQVSALDHIHETLPKTPDRQDSRFRLRPSDDA